MKNLLTILMLFTLYSCADQNMAPPNENVVSLQAARTESFHSINGNVTVKVLNIEDSRCPSDAVCVWQGIAKVTFELSDGINTSGSVIYLPEHKDQKSFADIHLGKQQFRVTLKEITPYPCQSCADQPASKAELVVKELD